MRRLLAGLAVTAALTGCASGSAAEQQQVELVVLVAASLTSAVEELALRFEREHAGVDVVLSAGASSALAQQVVSGVPADVFAAASPVTMRVVTDAGEAAGEPVVFARNRLQIAVPRGNPAGVTGLADLARADLAVGLCAAQVPCGDAARRALAAAGVTPSVDTLEQDVRAVLAKVRLGELDAGLVYVTDVRSAAGEVEGVSFPEAAAAVNDYPAVALRRSENAELAADFVRLLTSPDGVAVLAAAGFVAPP